MFGVYVQVVSNPHSGCIDQPCMGLAIQGMLRPAFFEEQSTFRKNMTSHQTGNNEINQVGEIVIYNLGSLCMHFFLLIVLASSLIC